MPPRRAARMIAGEDFDKIFKEYSDGASVGTIEKGQMVDSIENVVFNLKLEEFPSRLKSKMASMFLKRSGFCRVNCRP